MSYTLGAPGAGKTYARCAAYLVDDWIPFHDGVHYSNFPINFEAIAEEFPDVDIPARVQEIPREVLESWKREETGPWEYFRDVDLSGAHIAIDECHFVIPKAGSKAYLKLWEEWLSVIRHEGARIEFLTQNQAKVSPEIIGVCEHRTQITSGLDYKFPLIGISMGDWYQAVARLTGIYRRVSIVTEEVQRNARWEEVKTKFLYFDPRYFRFYDSYNATEGGGKGGKAEGLEWERLPFWRFWLWFLIRNFLPLGYFCGSTGLIVGFLLLCLTGNLMPFMQYFTGPLFATPLVGEVVQETAGQGVAENVEMPSTVEQGRAIQERSTLSVEAVGENWVRVSGVSYGIGEVLPGGRSVLATFPRLGRCILDGGDAVRLGVPFDATPSRGLVVGDVGSIAGGGASGTGAADKVGDGDGKGNAASGVSGVSRPGIRTAGDSGRGIRR
ncbi:MAG: zonular occludens toxin domain-containing protein [Planctomycetota bacterium]